MHAVPGRKLVHLPHRPAAVHTNPAGSRLAIRHFTEYLEQFPDDLGVRWLLNLAHMTLGEYPDGVPSEFLITLDHFGSEFDIGKFRDIGHLVGVNRFNQAGGAIMEDFDNDGLLDLVVTSSTRAKPMAFYRNKGDGTFEDRTEAAGLSKQMGGSTASRPITTTTAAWTSSSRAAPGSPTRCGRRCCATTATARFTDVTREAGLLDPVNSNCATWADYDNDGWLDLFIC